MTTVGTRFLLPFGVIAVLFSVFILHQAYVSSREHAQELVHEQAALALAFNLAIREYAAETIRPTMESVLDKDEFIPETMSTSLVSRNIFEKVREQFPGYLIRFASDHPRNPLNTANADELRLIEYFRQNPQISRETRKIDIDGRPYLAELSAKRMTPECMRCHGDPKDAPAALVERYGATASFHRTLGDVAGLDTVAVPLDEVQTTLAGDMRRESLVLIVGLGVLFGSVILVFRFVVTRRLSIMSRHFREIAASPASARMVPVPVGGRDEIGVLAGAFNGLIRQLQTAHVLLEGRVSERTALLGHANEDLKREILERQRAEEHLQERVAELQRWQDVTLGREGRIQVLKGEVNQLLSRLGEPVRYHSVGEDRRGRTAGDGGPEPVAKS